MISKQSQFSCMFQLQDILQHRTTIITDVLCCWITVQNKIVLFTLKIRTDSPHICKCVSSVCPIHSCDIKMVQTLMFSCPKCHVCVHCTHKPGQFWQSSTPDAKPGLLKEVEYVFYIFSRLFISEKYWNCYSSAPFPWTTHPKLLKLSKIDLCCSVSSDKAPEYWGNNEWVTLWVMISHSERLIVSLIYPRNGNYLKLRDRGSKKRRRC